jgi:hypothetical protein
MRRRSVIKNLALVVGGLVVIPACETVFKKISKESVNTFFSPEEEELITEIAESIIPATDTPGAKDLNVDIYIRAMIKDCHEAEVQDNFSRGLARITDHAKNKFGKSFPNCDSSQRLEIIKAMASSEDEKEKNFIALIKGLTIRGYNNSEYVMMNIRNYQMLPGHYHGCVPVNS